MYAESDPLSQKSQNHIFLGTYDLTNDDAAFMKW